MTTFASPRSVLVTGAGGNLGRKLIAGLLSADWCERVIALDRDEADMGISDGRISFVEADLANPHDRRWRKAIGKADAIVHFAAKNPYPDAPWDDACASYDMTLHVLTTAAQAGVRRVVFASSNHVMGRYKDAPLADTLRPGTLTTVLVPGPGTRWNNGREIVDGVAYATSKLMGERLCLAMASRPDSVLSTVSVRIGWCQPGDNRPETINASGLPGEASGTGPDAERDLRWFRNMWLSNTDFVTLMERALVADPAGWPEPGVVVNGMSANRDMPWDIETTKSLIGYVPTDNVWDHVER